MSDLNTVSQPAAPATPIDDSVRYSPKQIAAMFPSVTVEMLRNWESTGKIDPAVKTLGGHRRFTERHVQQIAQTMGAPRR
jgi:predicted site-specific integrase-resolvase